MSSIETESKRIIQVVPLVGLLVAACLFIIATYFLGEWAEASALGHTTQHILIFLAGSSAGASILRLFQK